MGSNGGINGLFPSLLKKRKRSSDYSSSEEEEDDEIDMGIFWESKNRFKKMQKERL
jgi:hypothetical protein